MNWEYREYPNNREILKDKSQRLLLALRKGETDPIKIMRDTRPSHYFLFSELTTREHAYFAGHYRGEEYPLLKSYYVSVGGDSRVGIAPHLVMEAMGHFSEKIVSANMACQEGWRLPSAQIPTADKILYTVRFSCHFLVEFLRIHPYANGNGHIARFLIFCFLAPFGIWPKQWPLDESPPYGDLISLYRDGYFEPLENFILKSVIGG